MALLKLLDVPLKQLDIVIQPWSRKGIGGKEIAVVALAQTEGDMDIETAHKNQKGEVLPPRPCFGRNFSSGLTTYGAR